MNIIAQRTRHLAPLHLRYALMRMQNKNIYIFTMTTALNRSRTCITGCGTHNHHTLITLSEHMIQQTTEQLQSKVFKGQSWTMEQFHHPLITIQLAQRSHSTVLKHTICVFQNRYKVSIFNTTCYKGTHYSKS